MKDRIGKDVRRGLLIGLGALSLAVREVDRNITKLQKSGKLSKAGARKLADKLLREGKKEKERLTKVVDRELDKLQETLEERQKKRAAKGRTRRRSPKRGAEKKRG